MNKLLIATAIFSSIAFTANAQFSATPQHNTAGGFEGPGVATSTVAEVLKMPDDTNVTMIGQIERSLGDEKYTFKDNTGTIVVEIDNDDWKGVVVKPENTVEIRGEVDKEPFRDATVDVDSVILK